MATQRKKPSTKKSQLGENNWLRTFYQLCGMDPERAEIAIARRNKEDPASLSEVDKRIPSKADAKRNS